MEKKTIDTLRVMLCGEIEDIAKQGKLSHESLDVLKDLVETEKNLAKIEKYDEEKKEKEEMKMMGGMSMPMEGGYSQRKYYIDADYQPGQSFARGSSYDMGNSYAGGGSRGGGQGGNSRAGGGSYGYSMDGMYARDGGMYDMGGQSRMYYEPMYDMPMYARAGGQGGGGGQSRMGGYARAGGKEEMVEELQQMMKETSDQTVKTAIQEAITKMNK